MVSEKSLRKHNQDINDRGKRECEQEKSGEDKSKNPPTQSSAIGRARHLDSACFFLLLFIYGVCQGKSNCDVKENETSNLV